VAAIVPLAGYIGRATEDLAQRLGTLSHSSNVHYPGWSGRSIMWRQPKTAPLARDA
jgi:hypothetical protein